MSQEASTRRIVSEPKASSRQASVTEDFISNEPSSMESYAEGLMDEIFSDLDQILDSKGKLPSTPTKPEYVALKTIKVPHIVVPETVQPLDLVHQPQLIQQEGSQPPQNQLSTMLVDTTIVKEPRRRQAQQKKFWSKLLLMGAMASVAAIALLLWMFNQGRLNRQNPPATTPAATQSQAPTQAQAEAELANYIARSLDSIEQKAARRAQAARTARNNPPINPPPVAANNQVSAVNNRPAPTTVLERIYIPVYQPSFPMRYAPPSIMGATAPVPRPQRLTNPPARPTAARKAPTAKSPTAKSPTAKSPTAKSPTAKSPHGRTPPKLPPLQTASQPVSVRPNPRLPSAPPQASSRPAPAPRQVPRQQSAPASTRQAPPLPPAPIQRYVPAPPPPAPVANHNLEGVLDLGDPSRDAALFNINGVTRQIRVGENIGASGWSLVEVVNNEAIIRRNGEVRSIYPGQRF